MKKILISFFDAALLFKRRKGPTLAAASSFYFLMTMIPLFLLVIRAVGFFIGDITSVESGLFAISENFFPNVSMEFLQKFREILAISLFGHTKITAVNFFILVISSLAFLNSIWNGLYLITGDRSHLSFWKHLKGIVVIAVTVFLVALIQGLPPLVMFLKKLIEKGLTNYSINQYFPFSEHLLDYLAKFQSSFLFAIHSDIFQFVIFFVYFIFVYKWFFSWKISYKNASVGAFVFIISIVFGRIILLPYFSYMKENLIFNYGAYYIFIIGMIWLFLTMCFFFYGAGLCFVLNKNYIGNNRFFGIKSHLKRFFLKLKLRFRKLGINILKN